MALGGSNHTSTVTFVGKDQVSHVVGHVREEMKKLGGPKFGPLGNIISGFAGLGVASLGVGAAAGAVTGFLVESTKAAIDEQKSIDQLSVSLKDNVPGWDGNTAAIERAIHAGEQLAFKADEQRTALAQLLTRTHDVGKATTLLAEAEDLARLKGIDLATASGVMGKVYGGTFTAANKMGIAIAKGSTATQALAQIQKAAAGQAEAYGNSTQGAMDRAGIAMHELEVAAGQRLAPALGDVASAFADIIGGTPPVAGALGDLTVHFDELAAARKRDQTATTDWIAATGGFAQAGTNILLGFVDPVQAAANQLVGLTLASKMSGQQLYDFTKKGLDAGLSVGTIKTELIQMDNLNHIFPNLTKGVDTTGAALDSTSGSLTNMASSGDLVSGNMKASMDAMAANAKADAAKMENYLGQIPVLGSRKWRDGLGLINQAAAEYKLAITQPITKASEIAAIKAQLTSKRVQAGLKSHNPQTKQDTIAFVSWLNAELAKITGNVAITARFNQGLTSDLIARRDAQRHHRAAGGPVTAGMPYTVGERGQETFVPNTNGTIIPNGAGARPIVIQMQVDGKTIAEASFPHIDRIMGRAVDTNFR